MQAAAAVPSLARLGAPTGLAPAGPDKNDRMMEALRGQCWWVEWQERLDRARCEGGKSLQTIALLYPLKEVQRVERWVNERYGYTTLYTW
mgnify:CR=1 FL=1